MLQAEPQPHHLPQDLLVSVSNALDHSRDLLACACVCKAWRIGKAEALMPRLHLPWEPGEGLHYDLPRLLQLNAVQMAAIRDVCMPFSCDKEDVAASPMLLAFVCGRLPMLQRLELDASMLCLEDFAQVGCTHMPDMFLQDWFQRACAFADELEGQRLGNVLCHSPQLTSRPNLHIRQSIASRL